MLGLDQIRLWHAAREAARIAVVDADPEDIEAAARRSGLQPLHVTVDPERAARTSGEPLTVHLAYEPRGHVPVVTDLLYGGLTLNAEATMRIERP